MMKTASVATKNEPCLLCGSEDWCYQIKNSAGEIYKILCGRTRPDDAPEGWEFVGVNPKDGRNTFINRGVRHRKKRGKLYPDLIQLDPKPREGLPQWQDCFTPLTQLSKGDEVLLKPGNPGGANTVYVVKRIDLGKRQGENTLIATLNLKGGLGGTMEVPVTEIQEILHRDPETGAKEQFIEYIYSETQKVVRTQWSDRRCVYEGKKSKKIRPFHKTTEENWVAGKGDAPWPLLRQSEAHGEIVSGGIVFLPAGEQACHYLWQLGLTATTKQGGETNPKEILEALQPSFEEARKQAEMEAFDEPAPDEEPGTRELKPLLVVWGDNDSIGAEFADALVDVAWKYKATAIKIDPLRLWSGMPSKGDAKDWISWCRSEGISDEEMLYRLELEIEAAIDEAQEDAKNRRRRANWDAPTSWLGEIGRWMHKKDEPPQWKPLCDFDFIIDAELKDSKGGGLVLLVKRSWESEQQRVIVSNADCLTPDKFSDAISRGLGVGVACRLSKFDLSALLTDRRQEYYLNRKGKTLRRIERYGQQPDGTWVFRDRQYKPNGYRTTEAETGWVFCDVSSEGDQIPCPELAPEDPTALKRLVDAARNFFGEVNFYNFLIYAGWGVATLHSQAIFADRGAFPVTNPYGDNGSGKTLAAEAVASLIGTNWHYKGMLSRVSVSALYEHGSKLGSLPLFWDDPALGDLCDELAKNWFNRKARSVRGSKAQEPVAGLSIISNHVVGSNHGPTFNRIARTHYEMERQFKDLEFAALQEAKKTASGAFPLLLSIGYDAEAKAAINALEREFLRYLPYAHSRIVMSFAIVCYYAQKFVEQAFGTEDVKTWLIDNIFCQENDSEGIGDSWQDFISCIKSLKSDSLVGGWNLQRHTTRDGREWMAIHYSNVWSLVKNRFNPQTYDKKALKTLLPKKGGRVDNVVVAFDINSEESRNYQRLKLQAKAARLEPPSPPEKEKHKAWLIPLELWGGLDDDSGGNGGGGGDNPTSPLPPSEPRHQVRGQVTKNSTQVTESYQNLVTAESAYNSSVAILEDTELPELPDCETKEKRELELFNQHQLNAISPPPSFGEVVTPEKSAETQVESSASGVTENLVTSSDADLIIEIQARLLYCLCSANFRWVRDNYPTELVNQAYKGLAKPTRRVLTWLSKERIEPGILELPGTTGNWSLQLTASGAIGVEGAVSSDDQQTKILFTAPGDNRQWQQTYSAIYANDIINCAIEGIKQIEAQLAQEQYLASNQVLAKTANLDNADSAANPGDAKGQESRVYRYTGNHVSTDLVEMKSGRSKVMSIEPGAEVVICENLENSSPKIVYVKPALGADNWDGGVKARREDLQPLD